MSAPVTQTELVEVPLSLS